MKALGDNSAVPDETTDENRRANPQSLTGALRKAKELFNSNYALRSEIGTTFVERDNFLNQFIQIGNIGSSVANLAGDDRTIDKAQQTVNVNLRKKYTILKQVQEELKQFGKYPEEVHNSVAKHGYDIVDNSFAF